MINARNRASRRPAKARGAADTVCVFDAAQILLAKANIYSAYNVKKAPSEYCFAVRPEGAQVSDAACRYCCATEQVGVSPFWRVLAPRISRCLSFSG